jgi:fructan beta-fructosidase
MFYQYNPYGDQWGHMSWGHAVSNDLARWQEMEPALVEQNGIGIFTGSAVLDKHNTSGFGAKDNPPLVAIYTGDSTGLQTQNLAYSVDQGRTWTRYASNPVLDLHEPDFRDPMVFWYAPTKHWVMVVSLALKHRILFFTSIDLKTWKRSSEFGPAGANAAPNWECPNLFELPVSNRPGMSQWVLEVGVGDNGPAGGSAGQYFVGSFDGTTFTNSNPDSRTLWVDYGADMYALQSWSNAPDGRRVATAWMDNWRYANRLPTSPWRGQMIFPRELTLVDTKEGIRLKQQPAASLSALRHEHQLLRNATWADLKKLLTSKPWPETMEIVADLEAGKAEEFGIDLRKGESYATRVGYDTQWQELYVDRTHTGDLVVHPQFASRQSSPLALQDGHLRLHILLDRASIEVFAADGLVTLTDLIYPRPEDRGMDLYARGPEPHVNTLEIWTLRTER